MDFKDKLNEYIDCLDCTAKDLADCSGLSAATISRYRSGERTPETDSDNFIHLVDGIANLAQEKQLEELTAASITDALSALTIHRDIDAAGLCANFGTLLHVLSINISEIARALNYDASYISRIKNGQRQPSRPMEFAAKTAHYIAHRCQSAEDKSIVAELTGCSTEQFATEEHFQNALTEWLINGTLHTQEQLTGFLEKLDEFNLNEYIRAIHFDELKVPTVPFQFPTSKSYFGLKEMMDSELAFLKATVLSKSTEPVIMYSDMPMEEMAKDPEFPRKWMFGMALMLKKGLHLNQIHNIDRSFEDMMLGLESWIPMYMTGQVTPYYLKGVQNNIFSHFLKVSGTVALTGEAINGFQSDGKYYLTKNKEEVAYYKKRASQLLSKASPLMEIYRADAQRAYHAFLQSDAKAEGKRRTILSALPLYTATDALLGRILTRCQIAAEEQNRILQYAAAQRERVLEILQHDQIMERIPVMTEEEFLAFPMRLSLSGMFYEEDLVYTWDDYQEHLRSTHDFAAQHDAYEILPNPASAFRNIQITIHEDKWVMVSKNKTPAVHFLIRHPKMRYAFEHMILPINEKEDVQ